VLGDNGKATKVGGEGREADPSVTSACGRCPASRATGEADWTTDFGGVVHRVPKAVVKPRNAAELSESVRRAGLSKRPIVTRGTAHSQGGQCLGGGACLVSTRELRGIQDVGAEDRIVTVGAGVTWQEVVNHTSAVGLIPPVLTDNLQVSVGGTLAVGGVGPTSFRRGLQLHHCAAVEAVLGDGQIGWFSREHRPELFAAILGGLGRMGIITRVRLELQPCPRYRTVTTATYNSLGQLLEDARLLVHSNVPADLSAIAIPEPGGQLPGGRRFSLNIGIESDEPIASARKPLLRQLAYQSELTSREAIGTHLQRLNRVFDSERYARLTGITYPWVESFLPWDVTEAYVQRVQSWVPETRILLWPMSQQVRWPSIALPDAEDLMLVGILARVRRERLPEALRRLRAASRLSIALGGKRYLSGWLDFTESDWRKHYGRYWKVRERLRRELDPVGVFGALPS